MSSVAKKKEKIANEILIDVETRNAQEHLSFSAFLSKLFTKLGVTLFTKEDLHTIAGDAYHKGFTRLQNLAGGNDSLSERTSKDFFDNVNSIGYALSLKESSDGKKIMEATNWSNMGQSDEVHNEPKRAVTSSYRNDARTSSFLFYDTSPIGKAFVKNLVSYVYGRGLKFVTQSPEVNKVLTDFWDFNGLESRQKRLYKHYVLNGEWYSALLDTVDKKGTFKLRIIPPNQIDQVVTEDDDIGSFYGIARSTFSGTNDSSRTLYRAIFYEDLEEPSQEISRLLSSGYKLDETVKIAYLCNGHEDETRGLPYMHSSFRWMRLLLEYALDRARFASFRHKIYGVVQYLSSQRAGSIPSYVDLPKSGKFLFEDMNRKFRFETPNIGGGEMKPDWDMLMYLVCSGLQMPPHILFQDSSNENYASIRKADTPFSNFVLDEQDELRDYWKLIFQYVVVEMVNRGKLPKTVKVRVYKSSMIGEAFDWSVRQDCAIDYVVDRVNTLISKGRISEQDKEDISDKAKAILGEETEQEIDTVDIPIDIVFPNVVHEDPFIQAQVMQILISLGLMSRYTARRKFDLDPTEEESRIRDEKVLDNSNKGVDFEDMLKSLAVQPEEE